MNEEQEIKEIRRLVLERDTHETLKQMSDGEIEQYRVILGKHHVHLIPIEQKGRPIEKEMGTVSDELQGSLIYTDRLGFDVVVRNDG